MEGGQPSAVEAEQKVPNEVQIVKEPEVQVVSTQGTTEQSSDAGTSETRMKSWRSVQCIIVGGDMRRQ
jgi:hypothetical protein